MAYPNRSTDWDYFNIYDAQACYDRIISALVNRAGMKVLLIARREELSELFATELANHPHIDIVDDVPYNDTWARDFGMITVERGGALCYLDFKFNGWGLKFASDRDNMICRNLTAKGYTPSGRPLINLQEFVLEGGSIESDGQGTIMTTSECLLSPNRNAGLTKRQIANRLKKYLGAKRILWLNHGAIPGDDTDSHIDTLARFATPDTIIYVKSYDRNDPNRRTLQAMERQLKHFKTPEGKPYKLVPVPQPAKMTDDNGDPMPATYVNFLITPRAVLMPVYSQQQKYNRMAVDALRSVFTDREVIPIDCTPLIFQHGSLHCVTMQLI